MAQVTITIPDADLPRVLTAVCGLLKYTPAAGTQQQFLQKQMGEWVKATVRTWESRQASAASINIT